MGKLTISMENHHAIQFGKSTNQWFRMSQDPITPRCSLRWSVPLCGSSRWGPGAPDFRNRIQQKGGLQIGVYTEIPPSYEVPKLI